jgi:hypothetical protein
LPSDPATCHNRTGERTTPGTQGNEYRLTRRAGRGRPDNLKRGTTSASSKRTASSSGSSNGCSTRIKVCTCSGDEDGAGRAAPSRHHGTGQPECSGVALPAPTEREVADVRAALPAAPAGRG